LQEEDLLLLNAMLDKERQAEEAEIAYKSVLKKQASIPSFLFPAKRTHNSGFNSGFMSHHHSLMSHHHSLMSHHHSQRTHNSGFNSGFRV
jgi:hypothetical protein